MAVKFESQAGLIRLEDSIGGFEVLEFLFCGVERDLLAGNTFGVTVRMLIKRFETRLDVAGELSEVTNALEIGPGEARLVMQECIRIVGMI